MSNSEQNNSHGNITNSYSLKFDPFHRIPLINNDSFLDELWIVATPTIPHVLIRA